MHKLSIPVLKDVYRHRDFFSHLLSWTGTNSCDEWIVGRLCYIDEAAGESYAANLKRVFHRPYLSIEESFYIGVSEPKYFSHYGTFPVHILYAYLLNE